MVLTRRVGDAGRGVCGVFGGLVGEGACGVFMPWVHRWWVVGLGTCREMLQKSWWRSCGLFDNSSSGFSGSESQVNSANS